MRGSIALGLAASLAMLGGCAAGVVGAAGAVGVAAVQDRTLGQGLDDANASNELKARLLSAGAQRYGEVDVEVANGLALLSGRVNDPVDRLEAEHIAWSVGLVRDVANEIVVEAPGGWRSNAADEWITARVRSRLLTDSRIKSVNYNIETYNGVVYLMGIAQDVQELQRAAEHASYVNGVEEVVSYVRVRGQAATPVTPRAAQPYYQPREQDELLGGPAG